MLSFCFHYEAWVIIAFDCHRHQIFDHTLSTYIYQVKLIVTFHWYHIFCMSSPSVPICTTGHHIVLSNIMYRWSSLFLLIVFHCPNLIISWKIAYYYISDKVLQASYSWGKSKFLNVSHIKADCGIKFRIKCKQLIAVIIEGREEEKLVDSDKTEHTSHLCFPYFLASHWAQSDFIRVC